jgi:hypothetical protein
MRLAKLALLGAVLTFAPVSVAQAGWVQHSAPDLGFSANFPKAPDREETTENGIKMSTFSAVVEGTMCLIIAADYGYTINPDEETVASRDNFAKGVKATVKNSQRIKVLRGATPLEAIRFDAESSTYIFRSLIVIEGQRAYQIAGGIPKPDGDPVSLDACVDGLMLTPKS